MARDCQYAKQNGWLRYLEGQYYVFYGNSDVVIEIVSIKLQHAKLKQDAHTTQWSHRYTLARYLTLATRNLALDLPLRWPLRNTPTGTINSH